LGVATLILQNRLLRPFSYKFRNYFNKVSFIYLAQREPPLESGITVVDCPSEAVTPPEGLVIYDPNVPVQEELPVSTAYVNEALEDS